MQQREAMAVVPTQKAPRRRNLFQRFGVNLRKHRFMYLLILPGCLYFLIFHYVPMVGIVMAFKNVSPFNVLHDVIYGPWVGLTYFKGFIDTSYFWTVMGNTVIISFLKLLFGFPAPIILALLLNEVRTKYFKNLVQTIAYLPHFLSIVVVAGMVMNFFSLDAGIVNGVITRLGGKSILFLGDPRYFRGILVGASVWQTMGWNTILYLAAITVVNPELYEAAVMDGASKWAQVWHITLPGIRHVIVILLILAIGGILNAGFEQILLLYSPPVYSVSDIVDTYVYREGLSSLQYSYATAVGVFKGVIALVLVVGANLVAKKLDQDSLF